MKIEKRFVCTSCMDSQLGFRDASTSYLGPALLCGVCGHFGHGATMEAYVGDWLAVKICKDLAHQD